MEFEGREDWEGLAEASPSVCVARTLLGPTIRTMPARKPALNPDATALLEDLGHPMAAEIDRLRAIVAGAAAMEESIKWNAPSYSVQGEHRVTFNLHAKDRVRLIFHTGARATGKARRPELSPAADALLEWPAEDRAVATFGTMDEIVAAKAALAMLVREWIDATAPA